MTSRTYDKKANRQRFVEVGCDPETIDLLLKARVRPETVRGMAKYCKGFLRAASEYNLSDIDRRLRDAGGDPGQAWQMSEAERRSIDAEREAEAAAAERALLGRLDAFRALGCDEKTTRLLLESEVDPDLVGTKAKDAEQLLSVAMHEGFDPVPYLYDAEGDPDVAYWSWVEHMQELEAERSGTDDDENEDDDWEPPTGPFVWGAFQSHWVVLSRAAAEERASHPEVDGDDWVDPRTIALDELSYHEQRWEVELGELVDNMGGRPFLMLDEQARDEVIRRLREDGYDVNRDDALFQRMK